MAKTLEEIDAGLTELKNDLQKRGADIDKVLGDFRADFARIDQLLIKPTPQPEPDPAPKPVDPPADLDSPFKKWLKKLWKEGI